MAISAPRWQLPASRLRRHAAGAAWANSAILGLFALGIGAPLALGLGMAAALRPGGKLDRVISSLAVGTYAVPEYVVGLVAILVFSIWWPILPGSSLMDPSENPLDRPMALIMPVGVLVLAMCAFISQLTRASMIQVMQAPYIRTAILKGVPRWRVVLKPRAAQFVAARDRRDRHVFRLCARRVGGGGDACSPTPGWGR